jgi:hypothetical protein
MKLIQGPGDGVTVELDFTEAIGLYKMALAYNHPDDRWAQPRSLGRDEDVGPLSASLQVSLSGIVGP